ncbi:MAG TPA: LysE family translocator [Acidimicrobiales bacterium]|nr:LysE family translocator [Acidimicrobiales bacterium]
MPTTSHLIAFALTAAVIIAVPGPSVMFIVGRALSLGRSAAVLSVVGNTAGEYVQVVLVAFGIGTLVERSVAVFSVVKLAGAAYLVFLGVKAFRERGAAAAALAVSDSVATSRTRLMWQGFVVGVSNPKTIVFLAAILPEFVSRGSGGVPVQILLLGLIFSAIALVFDSIWALAAGTARDWFGRSPRRLELLGGVGGLSIVAIGIGLALSRRKS